MDHSRRWPLAAAGFAVFAMLLAPSATQAQHVSELTRRDKSEIFIQHVVKFMKIQPEDYQAMVLEYEIGTALAEITKIDQGAFGADFIRSALAELNADFGAALKLFDEGKDSEAREAFRALARHVDPYVSSNAKLVSAELDFRNGRYQDVVDAAETLIDTQRMRLIQDHRACELVAMAFGKLGKPMLEFSQYYILAIDYPEIPPDVQKRTQAKVNELAAKIGKPLHTVAGWMNAVEKALVAEETGESTQTQERDIVTHLDKLIELQEARERVG